MCQSLRAAYVQLDPRDVGNEADASRGVPSGRKNDQVFQLSLTEIAFTLVFILLLMLGYQLMTTEKQRDESERALSQALGAEQAKEALEGAQRALEEALAKAGAQDPSAIVARITERAVLQKERDELRQRVEDLDSRVATLTEMKRLVESVPIEKREELVKDEVITALTLQDEIRKTFSKIGQASEAEQAAATDPAQRGDPQKVESKRSLAKQETSKVIDKRSDPTLSGKAGRDGKAQEAATVSSQAETRHPGKDLTPDELRARARESIERAETVRRELERAVGKKIPAGADIEVLRQVLQASDPKRTTALGKENADLRGQVMFLRNRLEARGGRDYPPCWADESGKVEFLVAIDLRPDAITVTPAWPAKREADAQALPGLQGLLAGPHTFSGFQSQVSGVFDWSRKQDPQCRHYVLLRSSIPDAVQSDRARLMVEGYFYKVEARR